MAKLCNTGKIGGAQRIRLACLAPLLWALANLTGCGVMKWCGVVWHGMGWDLWGEMGRGEMGWDGTRFDGSWVEWHRRQKKRHNP